MDNTTFGGDVPQVPQWSGPPHTIVQVQVVLYASLVTSLFSAFLAMLGKQWLNRYALNEMRGNVVECGRDRQRKLDGINSWYFEHVMESLPLMLQVALLLLGCALSRYLWEINTTIAAVVICVTSFGVTFYAFIVAAGARSESCPYQTPASRLLRSATSTIALAFRGAMEDSKTADVLRAIVANFRPLQTRNDAMPTLGDTLPRLPEAMTLDAFRLGRAMVQRPVTFARRVHTRLLGAPSTRAHGPDQQTILLDLQCISWVLRKSLDRDVHLSTLKSLVTAMPLAGFDPTLVAHCFNVFIGCMKVINRTVVITPGMEELGGISAMCLLRTFLHISVVDPGSYVLVDVRRHYRKIFPSGTLFKGFKFNHTLGAIHRLLYPHDKHAQRARLEWRKYKSSSHERAIFAHTLVKFAEFEYPKRGRGDEKVPRWILRFALRSLSLDPLPPTSVILDCLSIIAIDLGCDISNIGTKTPDERYTQV